MAACNAADCGSAEAGRRWCKPVAEELNCNVDATIFEKLCGYGIGMCIRNQRSEFVKAKSLL